MSVRLRTKWLWVRVQLQPLKITSSIYWFSYLWFFWIICRMISPLWTCSFLGKTMFNIEEHNKTYLISCAIQIVQSLVKLPNYLWQMTVFPNDSNNFPYLIKWYFWGFKLFWRIFLKNQAKYSEAYERQKYGSTFFMSAPGKLI